MLLYHNISETNSQLKSTIYTEKTEARDGKKPENECAQCFSADGDEKTRTQSSLSLLQFPFHSTTLSPYVSFQQEAAVSSCCVLTVFFLELYYSTQICVFHVNYFHNLLYFSPTM